MSVLRCSALSALLLTCSPAGAQTLSLELDRFELQEGQGDDPFLFDATASLGKDALALVAKAEGGNERVHLDVEEIESKLLVAYAPGDSTTLMAGVRHDFRPGRDLTYATIALEQAIGPIVATEAYLFLSQAGDVTGSAQVLAALPLTPLLVFEPRAGVGWSAQAIPEEDTAAGFNAVEFSARIRRSIGPAFNVYVGAVHEMLLDDTRRLARLNGERTRVTRALVGIGLSF